MGLIFQGSPVPYRPHLPSWRQPLYLHLAPLWRALRRELERLEGRVLDVGSGGSPYRSLLGPKVTGYVALDRPGTDPAPDVIGDAQQLPFADASFDAVFSTQVFEHVPSPDAAVSEAARVLRPGGRFLLAVPGVWPTHESPHDYWRFTRHGLARLFDAHGLDLDGLEALGGLWSTVGQMANLELSRHALMREAVPLVNLVALALDQLGPREDLVMNWMATGVRR